MKAKLMGRLVRFVLIAALLSGCASLTEPLPVGFAPPAPAIVPDPVPETTPLWSALVAPAGAPQAQSGFALLEMGADAYRARLALIEAATASLDVQSYIWEFDASGQAITAALLRAADRGVEVRVLIDGFRAGDKAHALKSLAVHRHVEVRLYNAFRTSFRRDAVRFAELATDFQRLNQRMHDKVLAADGVAAILGGRNVSDEYFGLSPVRYFHDRDVLVAGPLVSEVGRAFDLFWNSVYAVPVAHFVDPDGASLEPVSPPPGAREGFLLPREMTAAARDRELAGLEHALVWAEGGLVRSAPGPVFAEQAPPGSQDFETLFLAHVEQAGREIILQTPYLTLTPPQRTALAAARARGVDIILHTNSLASTDWPIVQHGYLQERRRLLHHGVRVFELKDRAHSCCAPGGLPVVPAKSVLHQKTLVIDGRIAFIGSFNFDNRSIRYNSEIGVIVDSPAFGERVRSAILTATGPENSWRLTMGPSNELVWLDESVDPPKRYLDDPRTGFLDQVVPWFGYFLPIDGLL